MGHLIMTILLKQVAPIKKVVFAWVGAEGAVQSGMGFLTMIFH